MTNKIIKSLYDIVILLTCLLILGMLIWIAIASIRTWIPLFKGAIEIEEKGFWAGLLIAILAGIMSFVEQWINTFAITYKELFQKQPRK